MMLAKILMISAIAMTVMTTFMITAMTTIMMTAMTSLPSHASYVESAPGSSSAHLSPPLPLLVLVPNSCFDRTRLLLEPLHTHATNMGGGGSILRSPAAAAESMFNQTFCWTPLPRPAPHPHISRVIRPFTITFTHHLGGGQWLLTSS